MSNQSESNAAGALQTGTKVALIVAAGFLATAVYFFMTPTHFLGKDGGIFGCGSPMSPNESELGKSQCSMIETVARDRALLFLALALITALLGFLLFGTDGKRAPREPRTRLEDEHPDDDDDDDDAIETPRSTERGPGRRRLGGSRASSPRARERDLDEDDDIDEDEAPARQRMASVGRPRFDETDEVIERDEPAETVTSGRKRRTRLVEADERPVRRRLGDEDEPREPRRKGRYDDDAFDSVRD